MSGSYELYLIRHGLAEERGDAWPDDVKRPLTEDGMERLRKEARGLARLDVSFDVVLTSPLVRARQTAEIIVAAFEPRPHLATIDSLAPGAQYASVIADLEKHVRKGDDCARRPRAGHRRAGGAPRRHAPSDRVQEGRGLPDRRQLAAAGRPGIAALVSHAESDARDSPLATRAADPPASPSRSV